MRDSTGASIIEVPISFKDRELGESKMSRAIVVEALWPGDQVGDSSASFGD